jgi:L-iditol 2-dehydrogenase
MPWYIEKKAPLVPGHEAVGEVIETGKEVTAYRAGDRIFPHHHAPCMNCRHCIRGDHVQCETWRNSRIFPGGLSEFILIPSIILRNDTIILPENVGYDDGALIEPTACAVKGFRRTRFRQGDTVLIIGLGVMGMINLLVARAYGAGRVIGADSVKFRLEKALELGIDEVIDVSRTPLSGALDTATEGNMAELVIVGPNSADAMMQGLKCVRSGGDVLLFTPAKPGEELLIDPNFLYFRDINVITSYSCGPPETAAACNLIEQGVVSAAKVVTHRFSVEETAEAFALTAAAQNSLKALIIFE